MLKGVGAAFYMLTSRSLIQEQVICFSAMASMAFGMSVGLMAGRVVRGILFGRRDWGRWRGGSDVIWVGLVQLQVCR
jgi:hypothetical protein